MKNIFLILTSILAISCQQSVLTTSEIKSIPINEKISWNIQLPKGWNVISQQKMDKIESKGKKAMEETIGEEVEMNHENLVTINKNQFNSLIANRQVYDSIIDGPYVELQDLLFKSILEAYRNQGIKFDYQYGNDTIDGMSFRTLSTTLYAPQTNEIILNQILWDRLFDDYALMININYNNDTDKNKLMNLVESSSFGE